MNLKPKYDIYPDMNKQSDFPEDENEEILVALLIEEDDQLEIDISQENNKLSIVSNEIQIEEYILEEASLDEVELYDEKLNDEIQELGSLDNVKSLEQARIDKFGNLRPKSKKQYILACLGLVTIVSILILVLLESPFYNVDKILTTNSSIVPFTKTENEKVTEIVSQLKDEPMYRVDTSKIEDQLSELIYVSEVSIDKTWPSSINVVISRRVPSGYVQTDKGFVLVDSTGMSFQKEKSVPNGLPSFEGMSAITFSEKIPDKTYVNVLNESPPEIKGQIIAVRKVKNDYTIELNDGIDVKLGDSSQLKQKLAITWSILNAKKRSEIGYIDVSVPSLPVSGSPKLQLEV